MTNIAILVGNADYQNLSRLECCHEDVLAIKELLDATEKYSGTEVIENVERAGSGNLHRTISGVSA
jgi:hypothetical protein